MANEQAEAQGWRPEEGETISGVIVDLTKAWSDQGAGSFYPLVTVKTPEGKYVNIHCFHHTLKTRLLDRKPKVGERLVVTYHGKRETRDGKRSVSIYSVETPDTVIDSQAFWQGLGAASPNRDAMQQTQQQQSLDVPEFDPDDPGW